MYISFVLTLYTIYVFIFGYRSVCCNYQCHVRGLIGRIQVGQKAGRGIGHDKKGHERKGNIVAMCAAVRQLKGVRTSNYPLETYRGEDPHMIGRTINEPWMALLWGYVNVYNGGRIGSVRHLHWTQVTQT